MYYSQMKSRGRREPGFVLTESHFVSSLLQLTFLFFFPSISLALLHLFPSANPHLSPILASTCTCGCYQASSGPSLWTGDDTVSRSLLSQSKCHSGGMTFPLVDAGEGSLHTGCHPCGSNHKRTLPPFHWQTFFPPDSTHSSVAFTSSFFKNPWRYLLKQWGQIKSDKQKIATVKYGGYMTSQRNSGQSVGPAVNTVTWWITSQWRKRQICFLDLFEGMGYTLSAIVFTMRAWF